MQALPLGNAHTELMESTVHVRQRDLLRLVVPPILALLVVAILTRPVLVDDSPSTAAPSPSPSGTVAP